MIQLILIILPTAYVSKPRPSLYLVITSEPLEKNFSFKLTILNTISVAKPSSC